jgi:hypothetical protein
LRIKFPPGRRGMASCYVYTPRHQCALFRLHVRFYADQVPDSIWRLQHTYPFRPIDLVAAGEPVNADRSGELYQVFTDPEPNHTYGVTWDLRRGRRRGPNSWNPRT